MLEGMKTGGTPSDRSPGKSSEDREIPKDFRELTENGGEVGKLLRAIDWSKSAIGPFETWPQSLKTALSICLASKFPMFVWWGKDLVVFYNDAYIPLAGPAKHPQYLGRPAREQWAEIWDALRPLTEQVVQQGKATWAESMELSVVRKGFLEETYFTFSYTPIRDEAGAVGGIINPCKETTEKVLATRRLKCLHELGTEEIKSIAEVGPFAASVLARNARDVPFAMLYLSNPSGRGANLVGLTGLVPGTAAAPERLSLDSLPFYPWPVGRIGEDKNAQLVAGLRSLFPNDMPRHPYVEMPDTAYVQRVLLPGQDMPVGFLILGVSPRLAFDFAYQTFFGLVAKHITTHISNVRALAHEKQRVETLAEIDRTKTAFFSNVSHEFRTPLTLMLGPLEGVLAKGSLPAELRTEVEVAHRNALRLLKLVNSLLDFARMEAGRLSAEYEPTDLAEFTAELASAFRSAIEKAGMKLIVDCPDLEEPVYVDRNMWEKIVLNLVSNAFKFTHSGEIRVTLRRIGTTVELEVRDTGIGIPAEELPHITERFHRIEGAHGRTYEGSGIGLALVSELVKLHAGNFRAESTVGVGSTFFINLPMGTAHLPDERVQFNPHQTFAAIHSQGYVAEAMRWLPGDVDQGASASGANAETSARALVLVADDNADMRAYMRRLLVTRYDVVEANDGEDAFNFAIERLPDVVLTDVMMPGLNGLQLLAKLRTTPETANIPVIMISARAGQESSIEGLEAGADDYLVKPFSAQELLSRVNTNLSLSRARQDAARQKAELEAAAEREYLQAVKRDEMDQMAQDLARINRELDQFAYVASHDLRAPLRGIANLAHWIQEDVGPKLDKESRKHIELLQTRVHRMEALIDGILKYSRAGRLREKSEVVEVGALLTESIELLSPPPESSIVVGPGMPKIETERLVLQQVFMNLIGNAIRHSRRTDPQIAIDVAERENFYEFSVKDNGPGIAPEFHERIWETFQTLESKDTVEGTGIGLALVKKHVETRGGKAWVNSEEGRGATFFFLWPKYTRSEDTHDVRAQNTEHTSC
jgi:signal transduction histidine kinase